MSTHDETMYVNWLRTMVSTTQDLIASLGTYIVQTQCLDPSVLLKRETKLVKDSSHDASVVLETEWNGMGLDGGRCRREEERRETGAADMTWCCCRSGKSTMVARKENCSSRDRLHSTLGRVPSTSPEPNYHCGFPTRVGATSGVSHGPYSR